MIELRTIAAPVVAVGGAPLSVIKRYVETQKDR